MLGIFANWRFTPEMDMDLWLENGFNSALSDLCPTSSVGCSSMKVLGPTIGKALGFDGIRFDPDRVNILKVSVFSKIKAILEGNYVPDPINTFVKPEPHKVEKIVDGRERLIMAVSLEDTMIDRMLYTPIMRNCTTSWHRTPVKVGYNFLQGMFRIIANAFPNKSLSADKKGWDFSVQPWLVEFWEDFIEDLMGGSPSWWVRIHKARFKALFSADTLFEFADGARARQGRIGVMKSGCFLTILLNSFSQVLLAYIARKFLGLDLGTFWATGDDTLEELVDDLERYLDCLRALGAVIKESTVNTQPEFCGFTANRSAICPKYWRKHLFKLFYEGGEHYEDKLDVYSFFYAFDEDMFSLIAALKYAKFGRPLIPRQLLMDSWSDVTRLG